MKKIKINVLKRELSNSEPFAGLVFKVVTDEHVGRLCYMRVYSGMVNAGDKIFNTTI